MTEKQQIYKKKEATTTIPNNKDNIQKKSEQNIIPEGLKWQFGSVLSGCFLGSYLSLGKNYHKKPLTGFLSRIRYTFSSVYYLQTSITFTSKLILDLIFPHNYHEKIQYIKGLLVGVSTFVLNTPLTHINETQSKILDPRHKKIGRVKAFNFMRRQYGGKSFYAKSNLCQFVNVLLFYTLYFGVYGHLTHEKQLGEIPFRYICNPFLASLAATLPTFIISRFCMTFSSIKNSKIAIAIGSGKKLINIKNTSILLQTVRKYGGLSKIPLQDKKLQFYTFMTNWLMLSFFVSIENETNVSRTTSVGTFIAKVQEVFKHSYEVHRQIKKEMIVQE